MTKSIDRDPPSQIRAVRRFNRYYAQAIEAMEGDLLDAFSRAEIHILFELAYRPNITAKQLSTALSMDAGYLSRTLAGLVRRKLVTKTRAEADNRHQPLVLSKQGIATFKKLDALANEHVGTTLKQLTPARRRKLVDAMQRIGAILDTRGEAAPPFIFRPPKPGDLGWIIHRHGTVISEEFGWDGQFEAMVTDIIAEFVRNYDASSDRCWIAEHDGEIAGSVFLVRDDDTTAKLRVLYVEPHMRGHGLGRKLVEKAVREAKKIGYQRVVLWTTRGLDSARKIYEGVGFTLVEETPHHEFTSTKLETVGQTWELDFTKAEAPAE